MTGMMAMEEVIWKTTDVMLVVVKNRTFLVRVSIVRLQIGIEAQLILWIEINLLYPKRNPASSPEPMLTFIINDENNGMGICSCSPAANRSPASDENFYNEYFVNSSAAGCSSGATYSET